MFTSSMYITLLLFKISNYYIYFSEFFKDIFSHDFDLRDLSAVAEHVVSVCRQPEGSQHLRTLLLSCN